MTENEITITDYGLASAMVALGHRMSKTRVSPENVNKFIFYFRETEEAQKHVALFYRKELFVEATVFLGALRFVKQSAPSLLEKNGD